MIDVISLECCQEFFELIDNILTIIEQSESVRYFEVLKVSLDGLLIAILIVCVEDLACVIV